MLRVKQNQPTLYQGIELLFTAPVSPPATVRQCDRHGNRREMRELSLSADLNEWAQWPHLSQVGRLTHHWTVGGQRHTEVSYLITSLSAQQATPAQVLATIRGHWGIENRLHWIRDVTFDEDRCQVRSGAAPQVLAACRNLVIGLLRRQGVRNMAAALRTHAGHPEVALALVTCP